MKNSHGEFPIDYFKRLLNEKPTLIETRPFEDLKRVEDVLLALQKRETDFLNEV